MQSNWLLKCEVRNSYTLHQYLLRVMCSNVWQCVLVFDQHFICMWWNVNAIRLYKYPQADIHSNANSQQPITNINCMIILMMKTIYISLYANVNTLFCLLMTSSCHSHDHWPMYIIYLLDIARTRTFSCSLSYPLSLFLWLPIYTFMQRNNH